MTRWRCSSSLLTTQKQRIVPTRAPHTSYPRPSIFLLIFSLTARFNRRHNDASRTGWPAITQRVAEGLNERTNWEVECEPKTLIMAGWTYRWGRSSMASNNEMGITSAQRWKGKLVGWGGRVGGIVDAHWPRPTAGLLDQARTILVCMPWVCVRSACASVACVHSHVSKGKLKWCACVRARARARASMLGRPKCHTGNYTHLRSFQSAEISTMHF